MTDSQSLKEASYKQADRAARCFQAFLSDMLLVIEVIKTWAILRVLDSISSCLSRGFPTVADLIIRSIFRLKVEEWRLAPSARSSNNEC